MRCGCCCVRSPACLAQTRIISVPFFSSHPIRSMLCILSGLLCLVSWVSLLWKANMHKFLSSAYIYFPLVFSPANMITTHWVKTDEGMRRGQIIHLQFYKWTGPIHADFSSIGSVSQQEVRQAEQPAQLIPLPLWCPMLLRQQLAGISQLVLSSFQGISGNLAHPPFFHCTLGEAALCSNFLLSFSLSE